MYVAVKGGEKAISNAHQLQADLRRGDRRVAELGCDQVAQQLGLAVDRVMTEGGIYDTELAALAIKQASGDLVEAIFLLRAYRTTLPRLAESTPLATGTMRIERRIALMALAVLLYYLFFFLVFGLEWSRLLLGCQQLGRYFLRMFIWHDFLNWPFGYYLSQVGITLGIVFAGTLTASLLALPLSFLAARNVMHDRAAKPLAFLVRRLFDLLRGIDMAIWGLIFVRALGMGPLAGVLAIILQDVGLLGKLYAEGHEAVERSPSRGLGAVGANSLQKHRFGIFTQSFPQFLALSLYQIESNTRSAAVLGFVGAGGVGLVYAENMRLWNWDVVMFLTLILVGVVMVMDVTSSRLRKRYISGKPVPLWQPAAR